MLLLFDVDLTLLSTRRAGIDAMHSAGRDLFGPAFTCEGIDYAGRLDPLIVRDLLVMNRVDPSPGNLAEFVDAYANRLAPLLDEPGRATPMPGVIELLDALAGVGGATLGVLTGNYERTGTMKLEAAGIPAARFPVRVWGDDSPRDPPAREHLPPVGIERFRAWTGRAPRRTVVIGDTVHDVSCAHANGCVALGVATGRTTAEQLSGAGADRVVPDLSATEEIVRWLTSRR